MGLAKRLVGWGLLVLGCMSYGGCVAVPHGEELSTYAERLNARGVQSCVWWSGHLSAYLSIQGVTATGGMTLPQCDEMRR